jgi:hypothetical protein
MASSWQYPWLILLDIGPSTKNLSFSASGLAIVGALLAIPANKNLVSMGLEDEPGKMLVCTFYPQR